MYQCQVGGALSTLGRLPWMLFIVLFLIATEYFQISLEGTVGYVFISIAVGAFAFLLDQFWAILTVVLATGLLSYLWFVEGQQPNFYHWIGFAIIIADALLNPLNAFRTALRNFDVPS
jgi:drug/metabolite transporter (DMT)-like permease